MPIAADHSLPGGFTAPRRGAARRSPEVLALVAFLLGAAACLTIAVIKPMSMQAPVRLGAVLIGVALAMAVGTFAAGDRLPRRVLLAEAVAGAVLNSVIVAASHTAGGVMGDAIAYAWLTVYVAMFFPRAAAPFAILIAILFAIAILITGLPAMLAPWAVVSLTAVTVAVVVARVSRHIRLHAVTDQLTGTLNRAGLAVAAERFGARRRRDDRLTAVSVLDLDDFKGVNDRDGHAAGDRLLAELTAAWRGALRAGDVLARLGGDEFVLLTPVAAAGEAAAVLARLERAHPARWSAGTVVWEPAESLQACLERADRELYAVKRRRR